jgi:hypothetical protein
MTLRALTLGGRNAAMVFAVAVSVALAGCTPAASGTLAPDRSPDTPTESPGHFPTGASSATALCQDASDATVAAVNAAMTPPDYAPEGTPPFEVGRLLASPDPQSAVWMLTGTIRQQGSTEAVLVVWATPADPTQPVFDGPLRSIGGQTAQLSSAPGLSLTGQQAAGGFPPSALRCLAGDPPAEG